jgi:hypothetical protein
MDIADLVKIHYLFYKNPGKHRQFIPGGWRELPQYSDIDSMVFKKENKIVIAMRGLDPSSPKDLYIGSNIIVGDLMNPLGSNFETSRGAYKNILLREQQKLQNIKKEYPSAKIEFAGHSRGGRKAIDLGRFNKLNYHAFNPGDASSLRDKVYTLAVPFLMGQIPTDNIADALGFASTFAMNMGDSGAIPSNFLSKLGMTSPLELSKPIVSSSVRAGLSDRPLATTALSLTEDVVAPAVLDYTMMGIGGRPVTRGVIEDSFIEDQQLSETYLTEDLLEAGISRSELTEDIDMEQLRYILDPISSQESDALSEYSASTFSTVEPREGLRGSYEPNIEELEIFNQIENTAESIYGKNLNDKSVLERFTEGFTLAKAPLLATQQQEQTKGNIYTTERDIVSHGYKGSKLQSILGRPEIVEPKPYVKSNDPTHHTIDHFISQDLYNKINEPQFTTISIQNTPMFSNEFIGSGAGGNRVTVNVQSLCEANPQLIECRYIL